MYVAEELGPETVEDLLSHESVQAMVKIVRDQLDGYNRDKGQRRKVDRRLIAGRNMRIYDLSDDPGETGDRNRVYDDRRYRDTSRRS